MLVVAFGHLKLTRAASGIMPKIETIHSFGGRTAGCPLERDSAGQQLCHRDVLSFLRLRWRDNPSHRARLPAVDFPPLAMIKSP
jgi:hypothetical protein